MTLAMWKNRCGCLHGHNEEEVRRLKKETLTYTITQCYLRRQEIPPDYQTMFKYPYYQLIKKYSFTYLKAWIARFHSIILHKQLVTKRATEHISHENTAVSDTSTISSFDSLDRQEYMVEEDAGTDGGSDTTQESGGEADISQAGEIQNETGVQHMKTAKELRDIWKGWGRKVKEDRKWFANDKPPRRYPFRRLRRSGCIHPGNIELKK